MDAEFNKFAEKLVSILSKKGIDISNFKSEIYTKELEKIKQAEKLWFSACFIFLDV